jgi:hypothetical protein
MALASVRLTDLESSSSTERRLAPRPRSRLRVIWFGCGVQVVLSHGQDRLRGGTYISSSSMRSECPPGLGTRARPPARFHEVTPSAHAHSNRSTHRQHQPGLDDHQPLAGSLWSSRTWVAPNIPHTEPFKRPGLESALPKPRAVDVTLSGEQGFSVSLSVEFLDRWVVPGVAALLVIGGLLSFIRRLRRLRLQRRR